MAKCPHCGSENTESTNFGECAVKQVAGFALATGAALLTGLVHPASGSHVGYHTMRELTKDVHLKYHCNRCGSDF